MKNLIVSIMVICTTMACFADNKTNAKAAAPSAPAAATSSSSSTDDAVLQKMADETGISKSVLKSYTDKLKLDELLMAYCIFSMSGNSISNIVRVCGNNFAKYYTDYHIDASMQANIQSKYTAMSARIFKQDVQTSTYAGIDQGKAALLIHQCTGVAKEDIIYYGFKSGIAENDILQAAEYSQASGNRFADIIYAKKNGSWADVWQKFGANAAVQASVAAKTSADTPVVFPPPPAAKTKPASVTPDMTKCSEILSAQLGSDKSKVMRYLNDGEPITDVVQGFVISSKTGNDVYNIFKLKNESGWAKVYSYYGIGAGKLAEITGISAAINAKITAP